MQVVQGGPREGPFLDKNVPVCVPPRDGNATGRREGRRLAGWDHHLSFPGRGTGRVGKSREISLEMVGKKVAGNKSRVNKSEN